MTDKNNQAIETGVLKLIHRQRAGSIEYQQIISSISHELRTPVSILKSNVQFIKEFSSDMGQDIKDESISMCEESIESIVAFLDNIQLINTAAKSQIIPRFSLFKQKNLIQQVNVELEKQNLNFKRISIHFVTPLSEIYSDPLLIRQILLNLCSNALKFSNGEVNLVLKTTSHELVLKIQDSGIGIPEEETDLIFNPFHRAANARRAPGYGLGLAIVSSLTDYLGGKIYMSSTVGQGTSFKIIIPCEISLGKAESML
jgi:signal transduction histidine kinase